MATRSTIAIENLDGTVSQVYCHWDGYVSYNGRILFDNYQDRDKVAELISLGNICVLAKEIGEKQDFDKPTEGWTVYYGRDRGETDVAPKIFRDFKDYQQNHQYEEYEYLFSKDGVWSVFDGDEWKNLELELNK